jgi:hypothetical protein
MVLSGHSIERVSITVRVFANVADCKSCVVSRNTRKILRLVFVSVCTVVLLYSTYGRTLGGVKA